MRRRWRDVADPVGLAVVCSPLWWLVGVDFAIYVFLAAVAFYETRQHRLPAAPLERGLALLCVVLFVAATWSYIWGGAMLNRVGAAYYNVAVLVTGLMAVRVMRSRAARDPAFLPGVTRMALIPFAAIVTMCAGGLVYAAATGAIPEVPTLFGLVMPGEVPKLIAASYTANLVRLDWIGDVRILRGVAMGPYTNATCITGVVLGCWSWIAVTLIGKPLVRRALQGGVALAMAALLVSTGSRAVICGVFAGIALAAFAKASPARRALIVVVIGGLALALMGAAQLLFESRAGSNHLRFENYMAAWEAVTSTNPLLGLGVKPDAEEWGIPLGSHSTFVSMFTKGGFVGLVVAVWSVFVVTTLDLWAWWKARSSLAAFEAMALPALTVCHVTILAWLVFEDVDAPLLAAYLIFSQFGMVAARRPARAVARARVGVWR